MIFDKFWFERFQRILITLLNIPLLGQILRCAMWVPELWLPITHIAPDAVHVRTGWGKRRTILYWVNRYGA